MRTKSGEEKGDRKREGGKEKEGCGSGGEGKTKRPKRVVWVCSPSLKCIAGPDIVGWLCQSINEAFISGREAHKTYTTHTAKIDTHTHHLKRPKKSKVLSINNPKTVQ